MRFALAVVALVALSEGFSPLVRVPKSRTSSLFTVTRNDQEKTAESSSTREQEKVLRKELAERNSVIEGDVGQYGVVDGENMEAIFSAEEAAARAEEAVLESSSIAAGPSLQAKMERMLKPRAYPLFLAEKAAELVEGTLGIKSISSAVNGINGQKQKEKIVVLGTGWGASTFLKEIDTDLYDVTVISPRNYFLFTPMLAGASVGTVEFRSITEPVREVCCAKRLYITTYPSCGHY
jgi:hypothetical protein